MVPVGAILSWISFGINIGFQVLQIVIQLTWMCCVGCVCPLTKYLMDRYDIDIAREINVRIFGRNNDNEEDDDDMEQMLQR